MVWTLVCSGRSGDSWHPQGVQNLNACGTLDGTITLDAYVCLVSWERQESGRIGFVGNWKPCNTSCDRFLVLRLLLNHLYQTIWRRTETLIGSRTQDIQQTLKQKQFHTAFNWGNTKLRINCTRNCFGHLCKVRVSFFCWNEVLCAAVLSLKYLFNQTRCT